MSCFKCLFQSKPSITVITVIQGRRRGRCGLCRAATARGAAVVRRGFNRGRGGQARAARAVTRGRGAAGVWLLAAVDNLSAVRDLDLGRGRGSGFNHRQLRHPGGRMRLLLGEIGVANLADGATRGFAGGTFHRWGFNRGSLRVCMRWRFCIFIWFISACFVDNDAARQFFLFWESWRWRWRADEDISINSWRKARTFQGSWLRDAPNSHFLLNVCENCQHNLKLIFRQTFEIVWSHEVWEVFWECNSFSHTHSQYTSWLPIEKLSLEPFSRQILYQEHQLCLHWHHWGKRCVQHWSCHHVRLSFQHDHNLL